VPILLFSGPLRIAHHVSNSWRPVGVRTTIDGVQGHRVTHIGGRSALQFYRDIFGAHSTPLNEMPMAVFEEGEQFYIRTPIDYDESDGSVGFSGTMSKNARVQLTEATPDGIINDVDASLGKLVDGLDRNWAPQAAIVASCVSRKWILGSRSAEEFGLLDSRLPKELPFVGFYSFGEIGPLGPGRAAVLHNCTMITLLLGEADAQQTDHPTIERKPVPAGLAFRSQQHVALLERKLNRARQSQVRLEYQKTLNSQMLKRLNEELVEANRRIDEQNRILRDSLSLAQQVQQRLLPQASPIIAGFDIAGRSIYCDETGGDYFDYLVLPEDHGVSVVVGDVSGHGIASALLMATARALLRMRASQSGRPCEFVTDLNRLLTSDVYDSGQFMTLFFLRLQDSGERLTWVRAGHEPALIYNAAADSFEELHGQGIAMGVRSSESYSEYTRQNFSDNELIVIGTDGIWEARDPDNRFFGKERFKDIIRRYSGCTAQQMLDYVLSSVQGFCRGRPFADDATLVVIQNKNNRRSSRCPNP
jgi:sigma-B regulation protein RsbU (phosphoserine phosphatase)